MTFLPQFWLGAIKSLLRINIAQNVASLDD